MDDWLWPIIHHQLCILYAIEFESFSYYQNIRGVLFTFSPPSNTPPYRQYHEYMIRSFYIPPIFHQILYSPMTI